MKCKILIPVAGFFALAIAFSVSGNSSQDEFSNLFVETDNIAYADTGGACCSRTMHYCIMGNYALYDHINC